MWWGTSGDTTNVTMCGTGPGSKSYYTIHELGPMVKKASYQAELCAKQLCNSHGTCWLPPPATAVSVDGGDPEGSPQPAPVKLGCDCDVGFAGDDCNTKVAP